MYYPVDPKARLAFALEAAGLREWAFDIRSGALTFSLSSHLANACLEQADKWSLSSFLERVHPEDRLAVRATIDDAVKTAQCWRFECRIVTPDCGVRWIEVTGCPQSDTGKISGMYGVALDITVHKCAQAVARGQQLALELAVAGAPLPHVLEALTRSAEEQSAGSILTAVLLLDADGKHLSFCAGPSLPDVYNLSIDGLAIGPSSGSCGSAAFFGAPIIVSNIETDPRWSEFRHLALPHGLRACWSLPILSTKGKVLGTMTSYCREVREPTARERDSMALLVNTAALVIERDREAEKRRAVEQALRTGKERFRSLVSATSTIVWTTSPAVEFVSPQPDWTAFTGQTFDDMKGKGWLDAIHPDDRAAVSMTVIKMVQDPQPVHAEYQLRRADGQYRYMHGHAVPIFGPDGSLREWAGGYTDITERKQAEMRLGHLATHDSLTGLPNRAYLNAHLQELINFTPEGESISVMLIDLDRFKQVNDSMGHGLGDALLCQVGHRLRAALPPGNLVARLGGDEFVVVAHVPQGQQAAQDIANELMRAIATPIDIFGNQLFSGASIGISLYPEHGKNKEDLIQQADIAMYQAKAAGRCCYRFFSAEMSVETKNRMALEIALRGALEKQEFILHYQPRLRLSDMSPYGVEALIRWNHPQRGMVSPMEFIPIAEETGLIDEIGIWVLTKACADINALSAKLDRPLHLSVNLSPRQLRSPHLVERIRQALVQTRMDPERLELELTESALIEDMEASAQAMRELKSLGVELAVDDFGTGYAGISYLRRFPIDTVKLDRTFVTPLAEGASCFHFIKAMSDMAHALDMRVVAEGVEDAETLNMLKTAKCDEAQGYLFAKPLPFAELLTYLSSAGSL